jgi:hypothetical protein
MVTPILSFMSLPAKILLGVHIFAAMVLMSAPIQALFNRTVAALPRQRALIMSIILLFTGIQNFTHVMGTGVPKGWHMWFGIKFLVALHLIAINMLVSNPATDQAKKLRLLQGAAISGFVAVLLAGYLNYLRTGH